PAPGRLVATSVDRDVIGNINQNWTRTAGTGQVESLVKGIRQIAYITHEEVVLDTRTCNAHGIALLEGSLAYCTGPHLAANNNHGDRVHICRGYAGDGVG